MTIKVEQNLMVAAAFSFAVFVGGCQTNAGSQTTNGTDTPVEFTKNELESFLSGKTYPVGGNSLKNSRGAFFFGDDGLLRAKWDGKREESTWSTTNESEFCYELQMFGGTECITLLKNPNTGGFIQVFEGSRRDLSPGAIVEGNRL